MGVDAISLLYALKGKDQAAVQKLLPRWGQPDGDLLDVPFQTVVVGESSRALPKLTPGSENPGR